MKEKYETPSAEKITFNYRDQVVAASGGESGNTGGGTGYNPVGGSMMCGTTWTNLDD